MQVLFDRLIEIKLYLENAVNAFHEDFQPTVRNSDKFKVDSISKKFCESNWDENPFYQKKIRVLSSCELPHELQG